MSKTELLEELAKLPSGERAEVLEALWAMEQIHGEGPSAQEAALLDAEYVAFKRDGDRGLPWEQVEAWLLRKA